METPYPAGNAARFGTRPGFTIPEAWPVRRAAAGEVLLEEGGPVRALLVLRSGGVEILRGGVRVAAEDTVGNVYGEMSLLLGQPASATVRALVETEFWELPWEEDFLLRHPALCLTMARLLAKRLMAANQYLADVRKQFAQFDDHVGMVDQILDAILLRNPRKVERRATASDDADE